MAWQENFSVTVSKRKKYPLGYCDTDAEKIFDFAYIADDKTVSYIQEHGRIMFIIRGPPGTGKATLSDMILKKYPSCVYCCADHYFSKAPNSPERNRETLRESHEYCQKKVETACLNNQSPIIVQNTHIKKREMQHYIDLAAIYNYTIIMAITLYKFDCTPEALEKNNTDGLDLEYFKKRMAPWNDVMPLFTGWFICPQDASYILSSVQDSLKALLGDGKFCSVFEAYDAGDVLALFKARKLLCCIAGYADTFGEMKQYYLSDTVQESYGKCYKITIKGYLISPSEIIGVVDETEEMKAIILRKKVDDLDIEWNKLRVTNNLCEYSASISLQNETFEGKTAVLKDWDENEDLNLQNCRFIDLAQNNDNIFNFRKTEKHLHHSLAFINDSDNQFVELDNGAQTCRLPNDEWFIKIPQKIELKTIFTGLYL